MNIEKIRKDFPILNQGKEGNIVGKGKIPIYFDNACTTLKPIQVLQKMQEYYEQYPSCGGRSHHKLGERVTEEVAKARRTIADFFNAKEQEIIFTRNTTEGINLIANSLKWKMGDVVLCSDKEHNSNLIPWLIAKSRGAGIRHEIFKFNNVEDFKNKIKNLKNVRLVSIVHTSNLDGSSNNVTEMIKIAHENNALVLLDAAQSAPHKPVNVKKLDVDFLVCSGHKMLGPSGTGILYGKIELLKELNQFIVGGETVKNSRYDSFEIEKIPQRFEGGLQNYSGIVGFAEAVRYLKKVGLSNIEEHEYKLNKQLTSAFEELGIKILGPKDAKLRSGILSFNIWEMNPHDVALMLDSYNIMIRSGMHCVHSWFNANKINGSARASFYIYNTPEEVDYMIEKIRSIAKLK